MEKKKVLFVTVFLYLVSSFLTYSQNLDKEISYEKITLALPNTWEFKGHTVENKVIQVACWDYTTGSSLLIQYSNNIIDPSDYIRSIIEYQKTTEIHSNAKYTPIKKSSFKGIKSEETEFAGSYKDTQLKGKIIAFNFNGNSFTVVLHGSLSFYNSQLSNSILNNIVIKTSEKSSSLKEGWTQFEIDKIAIISVPPSLELRDDNSTYALLQEVFNESFLKKKIQLKKNGIVFQPTGRNELTKESFNHYCRIIINHSKGNDDDFFRYNEKVIFSQKEKKELNELYRTQVEEPMKQLNTKIINWYPFEIMTIGDKTVFKISFVRQMATEKPVYVETYNFFNYNEGIEIILSYRLEDRNLWKDDFEEVIKSFNFLELK